MICHKQEQKNTTWSYMGVSIYYILYVMAIVLKNNITINI